MKEKKINLIYILGGGHSGSTVLSLILGTAPEVFNVGELKLFHQPSNASSSSWDNNSNRCMCGESLSQCPFWKQVSDLSPDLEIFHNPGIKGYLKQFFTTVFPFQKIQTDDDYQLIKNSMDAAVMIKPSTVFILDISKSLPRLMHLQSNPKIAISTVFLVRDGRGYLNSYRKRHQKGFFRWIFQWASINLASLAFLSITKRRFYQLSYEKFCRSPEKYISEINQFFGIKIPTNYVEAVNETEFHIQAANASVLDKDYFSGLALDEKWKTELSPLQRWIASVLILPLNKFFSV